MEQYLPIIIGLLSGGGGGILAGKAMNSNMGTLGRAVTGIIGGGGLAAVLNMVGGGDLSGAMDAATATASGALDPMTLLKSVGGGAVGGGILTAILGKVMGGNKG
ncbi:hypothetical protein ACJ3XI_10840 [Litorimonas sp. RW-G-Af-16]|uniref:hypothetical protein n=1 Tax=Litorimonas sp. RW-G-Af-16 TaxID=3241168 RepID=UPI00390CB255